MIRHATALGWALAAVLICSLPVARAEDGAAPNTGTLVTGITSVYAIVAGHGHIYLTPGQGTSTIAVMNPDGSQAGTIDNVPGASGAVIVHGVLYVAAFGADEIERFDLSTEPATKLAPLATAPLSAPRDLGYAGGHLWFTTRCGQFNSHVGWMPLDGSWVKELTGRDGNWNNCTGLEANRYAPNRIFLHNEEVDPTHLFEFAVGKTKPRLVASDPWDVGRYRGQPATPLPGGHVFAMSWSGGNPATFSMDDLTGPIDQFHGIGGTIAVTDRNGGFVAATRRSTSTVPGQVKVWHLGSGKRAVEFDFGDDYPHALGPLAFSPDGTALYVVTGSNTDDNVAFRVLDPTMLPSTIYAVATDYSIKAGQGTDIDVFLDTPGTNRDVTLMAAPWQTLGSGPWQEIGTHTVDANGQTTFHVTPTRNTNYAVEYAGDATTAPSGGGTGSVDVEAAVTGQTQDAYAVTNGVAHYHDADAVTYAIHVVPDDIQLWFHVHVEVKNTFGFWSPLTNVDVAGDGSGNADATFDAATFDLGHYRASASSYGSVLVGNGQSSWTKFVIDP